MPRRKAPSNGRPVQRFFRPGLGLAVPAPARPPAREARPPDGQVVPGETVDRLHLLPADLALLDHPGFNWQHLQTEHFVLHHDQRMFAARVARLGEQFYQAISADLPDLRDRIAPARSHIFIFRNPRDWQAVVAATPGLDPGPPRSCAATPCTSRNSAPPLRTKWACWRTR
jgi:hypothetical protein